MQVGLHLKPRTPLEKKAYSKQGNEDAQQIVIEDRDRYIVAEKDGDSVELQAGRHECEGADKSHDSEERPRQGVRLVAEVSDDLPELIANYSQHPLDRRHGPRSLLIDAVLTVVN